MPQPWEFLPSRGEEQHRASTALPALCLTHTLWALVPQPWELAPCLLLRTWGCPASLPSSTASPSAALHFPAWPNLFQSLSA